MSLLIDFERDVIGQLDKLIMMSSGIAKAVAPLMLGGITIYVMTIGIMIVTGRMQAPTMSFILKIAKIAIVLFLATGQGVYGDLIVPLFRDLQSMLIAGITTKSSIAEAIVDGFGPLGDLMSRAGQQFILAGFFNGVLYFVIFAICATLYFFMALGSIGVWLVANVLFAFTMVLGPFFILCYMFPPFAPLTEAWAKTALQLVITNVLLAVGVGFVTKFMADYASKVVDLNAKDSSVWMEVLSLAVIGFGMTRVIEMIPTLAQSLVGGMNFSGQILNPPAPKADRSQSNNQVSDKPTTKTEAVINAAKTVGGVASAAVQKAAAPLYRRGG